MVNEVFTELFYGEGRFLGLILVITIILAMHWRKKEASLFFIPINILWGLDYLTQFTSSDPFFYAVILFMALPIFLGLDYWRNK